MQELSCCKTVRSLMLLNISSITLFMGGFVLKILIALSLTHGFFLIEYSMTMARFTLCPFLFS